MTYAERTTVAVGKSREQVDKLLRQWGCDGIRWTDHFTQGLVALEFIWTHEEQPYLARVSVHLPCDDELRDLARHAQSGAFLQSKFEKLCEARGRSEHRLLLLWLKACFNAIEAGIISAETVFLPFLVGMDGRTVADAALPRLPMLLADGSNALLPASTPPTHAAED